MQIKKFLVNIYTTKGLRVEVKCFSGANVVRTYVKRAYPGAECSFKQI